MTCVELQESLAEIDSGKSPQQLEHLKHCAACARLMRELTLIESAALELREADEPSPRVWNSIEIALRQEGLIRDPRPSRSLMPSFTSRWQWARWTAFAAATLLVVIGLYVREQRVTPNARVVPPSSLVQPAADVEIAGLNDDDLLQEIAQQTPALQAQYTDNLRRVNEYIRDATGSVEADPNDEEARRSLLEAYQQKAMLFELAMDRSLP